MSAPERGATGTGGVLVGALTVIVVTACAGMLAFWAAMLVPLRVGTVIVPAAILLAIATTAAAPIVLRYAGLPLVARMPPLIVWFIVVVALGAGRPEGDRPLPAGDLAWVSYGVMLGGAVAGAIALLRPERRVESRP